MTSIKNFSFRSIDIGFDLRLTGHEIARPRDIGAPSETITVEWDGGSHTGRACDCGARLRKAGYRVSASWFAGRADWGQPIIPPGHAEECALFDRIGQLATEEIAAGTLKIEE